MAFAVLVGIWLFNIYGVRPVSLDAERVAVENSRQYSATQKEKLYSLQLEWENLERERLSGGPAHIVSQQNAILRQMQLTAKQLPSTPADIKLFLETNKP